eukprot:TRINITY_DN968_c0_g1_i7.p1 TRINITY_DN968_c0_g1~~TRINITY_DN968_c0_g1_i7.p1  ORF type:complete len:407 (-),score=66.49 TRINITY_DN968_c0_g1_i7:33-1253(-)
MRIITALLLASVCVVIYLVYSYIPIQNYPSPLNFLSSDRPLILSHRGSRLLNPENTILAFKNSLWIGADVIETDVRITKDKKLVIFHDDAVDRVTNGKGLVKNLTFDEIRSLDAGYWFTHDNGVSYPFRGKGIQVPTIEEVYQNFPDTFINIEIKDDDVLAAELLHNEIMKRDGWYKKIVVGGRFCKALNKFRKLSKKAGVLIPTSACEPEVIHFLTHCTFHTHRAWFGWIKPYEPSAFQVPVESGPFRLDTSSLISCVRELNKKIHYWVVNNPNEMKRLVEVGADALITDRPDLAVEVFRSMGLMKKLSDAEIAEKEGKKSEFYIPVLDFKEVHTCISFTCRLFEVIGPKALFWSILFLLITTPILLKNLCSRRNKNNSSKNNSNNNNNNNKQVAKGKKKSKKDQ